MTAAILSEGHSLRLLVVLSRSDLVKTARSGRSSGQRSIGIVEIGAMHYLLRYLDLLWNLFVRLPEVVRSDANG